MSEQTDQIEQWAIIELMGHQQIAGRYQEAAGGMHRVDVPDDTGFRFTRLYSPAAIYSITFVDEQSARVAARMLAPKPITVWGFEAELKRLSAPAKAGETIEGNGHESEDEDMGEPWSDRGDDEDDLDEDKELF